MTKCRGTLQYRYFDSSYILSILISTRHSHYLRMSNNPFSSHTFQGDQICSTGHLRSTSLELVLTLPQSTALQSSLVPQTDPVHHRSRCNHSRSDGNHLSGSLLKAWKLSSPSLACRDSLLTCRQDIHLHGRSAAWKLNTKLPLS